MTEKKDSIVTEEFEIEFDPKFTKFRLEEAENTFKKFDRNNQGFISIKQFKIAMLVLGFKVSYEEIISLISSISEDLENVSHKTFLSAINKTITKIDINEEGEKIFKLFDLNQTEKITFNDLKKVAEQSDIQIKDEEAQHMIYVATNGMDDEVTYEQFFDLLQKMGII
ncbi:centrin-1 [Anaeramoeba flamelloides]|uniref:Centrin-1 n=1 Tax=Anaeramoeba flamelloides TaxID=1746091 RepID=A0AAV7YGF7_9EUKA|nr:centrin-1 [Anaeramoeba flamelloides]KAJ6244454.1 centrin-1 [Anaeramoeba flamelloides]